MNIFRRLKNLKLLNLLSDEQRKKGSKLLILIVLVGLMDSLSLASVMPFLSLVGNPNSVEGNFALSALANFGGLFGVGEGYEFVIFVGILSFLIISINALVKIISAFFLNRAIEGIRYSLSARIIEGVLGSSYEFIVNHNTGDILKSVLSEVDQFSSQLARPVVNMLAQSVVALFIVILLIIVDPVIAVISAGTISVLYFLMYRILRKRIDKIGRSRSSSNQGRYRSAAEALGNFKYIKVSQTESWYLNQFNKFAEQFSDAQARYQTFSQVPQFVIEAVAFGGIILLTLVLLVANEGTKGLGGVLPLLGLYAFAAYRLQPAIRAIFQGLASLRFGEILVRELSNHMSIGNADPLAFVQPAVCTYVGSRRPGDLVVSDVSFQYPGAPQKTLDQVSFRIRKGDYVGVVGPSGSGKTTLVDLLLGLHMPTEGRIYFKGAELTVGDRDWKSIFSYVPQSITLIDGTIAENVAFGLGQEDMDRSLIERVLSVVDLSNFLKSLPNGIDTQVGERGALLSGGQVQRIGIARALYQGAPILILDEATAALDRQTENVVMKNIRAFCNSVTIISIAHREHTLKKCNVMLKVEDGFVSASNGSCFDFGGFNGE